MVEYKPEKLTAAVRFRFLPINSEISKTDVGASGGVGTAATIEIDN
jgi:hypothetical protein